MAGRYTGPLRLRLSGPGAERYVQQARVLLGQVLQRRKFGGLNQLIKRVVLPDGTQIVVGSVFNQHWAEIYAEGGRILTEGLKLESGLFLLSDPKEPIYAYKRIEAQYGPQWTKSAAIQSSLNVLLPYSGVDEFLAHSVKAPLPGKFSGDMRKIVQLWLGEGKRVHANWKWAQTHGALNFGGEWYFIEISAINGVLAWKASTIKTKKPDNSLGLLFNEESFSLDTAQVVLSPKDLAEFYQKSPFFTNCGWAFPSAPNGIGEALVQNTAWYYKEDSVYRRSTRWGIRIQKSGKHITASVEILDDDWFFIGQKAMPIKFPQEFTVDGKLVVSLVPVDADPGYRDPPPGWTGNGPFYVFYKGLDEVLIKYGISKTTHTDAWTDWRPFDPNNTTQIYYPGQPCPPYPAHADMYVTCERDGNTTTWVDEGPILDGAYQKDTRTGKSGSFSYRFVYSKSIDGALTVGTYWTRCPNGGVVSFDSTFTARAKEMQNAVESLNSFLAFLVPWGDREAVHVVSLQQDILEYDGGREGQSTFFMGQIRTLKTIDPDDDPPPPPNCFNVMMKNQDYSCGNIPSQYAADPVLGYTVYALPSLPTTPEDRLYCLSPFEFSQCSGFRYFPPTREYSVSGEITRYDSNSESELAKLNGDCRYIKEGFIQKIPELLWNNPYPPKNEVQALFSTPDAFSDAFITMRFVNEWFFDKDGQENPCGPIMKNGGHYSNAFNAYMGLSSGYPRFSCFYGDPKP